MQFIHSFPCHVSPNPFFYKKKYAVKRAQFIIRKYLFSRDNRRVLLYLQWVDYFNKRLAQGMDAAQYAQKLLQTMLLSGGSAHDLMQAKQSTASRRRPNEPQLTAEEREMLTVADTSNVLKYILLLRHPSYHATLAISPLSHSIPNSDTPWLRDALNLYLRKWKFEEMERQKVYRRLLKELSQQVAVS